MYGTPWRKHTGFLCTGVDLRGILKHCSSIGGCDRTGQPHHLLQGVDPKLRRFWTIIAEPYPRRLCTVLCKALIYAVRQGRSNSLHRYFYG